MMLATNACSSDKDGAKEEMVGAVLPDDPTECVDVFEVNNSVILWKCYATCWNSANRKPATCLVMD